MIKIRNTKQQEQSINIISSLPTIDNVETNDDASSVKIENNNIVEKTIKIKKDEEEKENRIKIYKSLPC